MNNENVWIAILKSPFAIAVISLLFVYKLIAPIVDTIPTVPPLLKEISLKLDNCITRSVIAGKEK